MFYKLNCPPVPTLALWHLQQVVPAHCQNKKMHPGKTCIILPAHDSYFKKLSMCTPQRFSDFHNEMLICAVITSLFLSSSLKFLASTSGGQSRGENQLILLKISHSFGDCLTLSAPKKTFGKLLSI